MAMCTCLLCEEWALCRPLFHVLCIHCVAQLTTHVHPRPFSKHMTRMLPGWHDGYSVVFNQTARHPKHVQAFHCKRADVVKKTIHNPSEEEAVCLYFNHH